MINKFSNAWLLASVVLLAACSQGYKQEAAQVSQETLNNQTLINKLL